MQKHIQGCDKIIAEVMQVIEHNHTIVQEYSRCVEQLGPFELELNAGMVLILPNTLLQRSEFFRWIPFSGQYFCTLPVQAIHVCFLPAGKLLAEQFPVLVCNFHFEIFLPFAV
ncbi:MAG: hypothetical protein IJ001_09765 [Oscillospiraceae bacterium]|nr:hypothetical protein [Oscillospiraceae bacterium]